MEKKTGDETRNDDEEGTLVVYSIDERRFEVPLEYLKSEIFQELFKMAEEEFGFLSNNGPARLTSDAALIEKKKPVLFTTVEETSKWVLICSNLSDKNKLFKSFNDSKTFTSAVNIAFTGL
ncbi:auxin-responsive protein SAUR64-like [Senna tora]|uniref:Auxin-responsive protein SAUR64-like n=1 Tax=Senna tora TaxID=362788 RepID=A0A834W3V9_9FABA|nr:auxin-responsive protein SAUR64-like [Senna tora]